MTSSPPDISEQSWVAELELDFAVNSGKTRLTGRKQRGPLAVQRPFYPEGELCHCYVLHPPGGVVGGDQLRIVSKVNDQAHSLLTTPGATKFYRSENKLATQYQHLSVTNGTLEWLPQENIFFPSAHAEISSRIELAGDARFIGWEVHCLGQPANRKVFEPGYLELNSMLYRDGMPCYIDRIRVSSNEDLQGAAGLRGQPVLATLLATPATGTLLISCQELCDSGLRFGTAGITLMNDVLILRYLGSSTAEAHTLLRKVWMAIRPAITGREAIPPRIWAT